MKTKNFLIAIMLMLALVFTSCELDEDGNGTVDAATLETAITAANTLLEGTEVGLAVGNVSQDGANAYDTVITAAEVVFADTAATQAEIDTAFADLATATTAFNAAIVTVDPVTGVNKAALTTAITTATALNTATSIGTEPGNVAEADKTTFTAAIATAQAVVDNADATQTAVDSAVTTLATATTAFNASKVPVPTDYTALTTAVATATTLVDSKTVGTEVGNVSDKTVFTAAIATAQVVLDDTAATQAAVDAAIATLATATTAFNALVIVPVDYTVLTAAVATANTLVASKTVGTEVGNVSDKTVFTAAIATAQVVLDDTAATQAAVDAAVATLATATAVFNALVVAPAQPSLVVNDRWAFSTGQGTVVTFGDDLITAEVTALGGQWDTQIFNEVQVTEEGDYIISITASSDVDRDILLRVDGIELNGDDDDGNQTISAASDVVCSLTSTPQTFTTFVTIRGLVGDPRLKIVIALGDLEAGGSTSVPSIVTLSNFMLRTVGPEAIGPDITLTAGELLTVGDVYAEPGFTATDNLDDDATITAAVVVDDSAVNTAIAGSYAVTYTATDSNGNVTVVTRTVTVAEAVTGDAWLFSTDTLPVGDTQINYSNVETWEGNSAIDTSYALDTTYNPVIQATWNTGWGNVVSFMTAADSGAMATYNTLKFKFKAGDFTEVKVKLVGAGGADEAPYQVSTGVDLADGWKQFTIDLTPYGSLVDLSQVAIFAITGGSAGNSVFYLTDVMFQ